MNEQSSRCAWRAGHDSELLHEFLQHIPTCNECRSELHVLESLVLLDVRENVAVGFEERVMRSIGTARHAEQSALQAVDAHALATAYPKNIAATPSLARRRGGVMKRLAGSHFSWATIGIAASALICARLALEVPRGLAEMTVTANNGQPLDTSWAVAAIAAIAAAWHALRSSRGSFRVHQP